MATEALKSAPITNLDTTPPLENSPGEGGLGVLRHVSSGSVSPTNGDTAGSTYQLVRLPSNAKLKSARVKLDATVTTFTGDVGFYYSTSTVDGTPAANQGSKVNSNTGGQLLGAAVALASQTAWLDLSQNIAAAKQNQPLWQACGLSSDPGGYFDMVITTTATTSGAPVLSADASYVQ